MLWWVAGASLASPGWQVHSTASGAGQIEVVVTSTDPELSVQAASPQGLRWSVHGVQLPDPTEWQVSKTGPTTLITAGSVRPLLTAWEQHKRLGESHRVVQATPETFAYTLRSVATDLPPGGRIVVLSDTALQIDNPGATVPTRLSESLLLHVVVVTPPTFGATVDPVPGLRGLVERSGGTIVVAPTLHDAAERIPGLQASHLTTATTTVRPCIEPSAAAPALGLLISNNGATPDIPIDLTGVTLPACAAAAPPPHPASPPARRWWTLGAAGLGFGAAMIAVGLVFFRRRRPPPPPAQPEAPVVGHLVQPPPSPDSADAPSLHIVRGLGLEGQIISLSATKTTIGRAESSLVMLELPGIAPCHVTIERFVGGTLMIIDSSGASGTWVGGERLVSKTKRRLRHGDRLRLGPDVELELDCANPNTPGEQEL